MTAALIAVVGLKREAGLIRGPGVLVAIGGGDEARLQAQLERLAASGSVRAVVSVGIGGALSPDLGVGDWVVADRVVNGAETLAVDQGFAEQLRTRLRAMEGIGRVHVGPIAAGDVIVASAAEKAALFARTGALAVEMESHVAAQFAAARVLPFATLRVISDAAAHALPPAVMVSMKPDGGVNLAAILGSIARDPRQLPALIRTGREAEVAFRQLRLFGRNNLLGRLGVGDADLGQLLLDVV